MVESKRGGNYNQCAKDILKKSDRTIRRLSRIYNVDKFMKIRKNNEIKLHFRRISKNFRDEKNKNREKFGIKILNSVKEALSLDKINKNTLWADAMKKEMNGLNNANCFSYFPGHHRFSKEYLCA